jgi:hypothetical protein
MMEMLVASTPSTIELLPALPPGLEQGSIYGVKGRNRVTVQRLSWDRSRQRVSCVLRSDIDQHITLIERNGIGMISTQTRVGTSPLGKIARVIYLPAGRSVLVSIGTTER